MYGTVLTAAIAISGASASGSSWELPCECPLDLLMRDLRTPPQPKWPVPGSPVSYQASKKPWLSVSLMPDIVGFEDDNWRTGKSFSFSISNEPKTFKAQLLRRFGLMEVRSRAFGATLRFAGAPNWAFQFKGTRRLTVAYVTRF